MTKLDNWPSACWCYAKGGKGKCNGYNYIHAFHSEKVQMILSANRIFILGICNGLNMLQEILILFFTLYSIPFLFQLSPWYEKQTGKQTGKNKEVTIQRILPKDGKQIKLLLRSSQDQRLQIWWPLGSQHPHQTQWSPPQVSHYTHLNLRFLFFKVKLSKLRFLWPF